MNSKLILQIDDDEDDCLFFRDAVSEINTVHYISIQNPQEALQQLVEGTVQPNLIFLDINMPIMTGYEFIEKLSNHPLFDAIPIYIFSTNALPCGTEVDKRVSRFFTKPTSFQELKKIIVKIADRHLLV